MTGHVLQAVWPLLDDGTDVSNVFATARDELPGIARQAHARITGRVLWDVRPSWTVPGSGNVTAFCLVARAIATPTPPRPYRRA